MDPHSFIARAEAQRWLGIAEKLLMSHDLVGSKTFAIRARDSDPRLEAADQILAIADTLLAAEKRVVGNNGAQQPDFYAILQLVRFVQDTEHIASQYRRLAVMLNPHQNRFPYSDQAFQLVNDAWAVLSNPMRKSMYDSELDFPPQQQMNSIGFNLEQQQHHHHHQHHHQQQQQHNFFSINHMSSGHEQELAEPPQTFQSRVQQSHQQQQQQQLQQHNFLSQPNPVRPLPVREQEQLFQHREQEQLFQPQVQPFQVTSVPQQQTRPSPQPPQPQLPMRQPTPPPQPQPPQPPPSIQSPTPPPPAAPPQPPFSWPQAPPLSQPQQSQTQQQQQQHLQPQPQPLSQPKPQPQQPLSQPQPQSQSQSHPQPQPQPQAQHQPQPQMQQQLQQKQHNQQLQQEQEQQESLEQNASPVQLPGEVNGNNGVRDEEIERETEAAAEDVVDDDSPTFWTACPYCFYMYEYPKVYAECTLRCDNCKRAFQAVRVPSPPPIIDGQEACFYCWGFFPLGVSMSHLEKNNGKGTSSKWTPFSPLHEVSSNVQDHLNDRAAPKENLFVNKSSGPRIYIDDITDDVFMGISEPSDDSDAEWDKTREEKVKRTKKALEPGFKNRPQVLAIRARDAINGSVKNLQDAIPGQEVVGMATVPVAETSKKAVGGNPRRQSGWVAKELGKLDLNVEFNNNEGEEPAPRMAVGNRGHGQGEEDNIEGIGFFEGLDEFLSSLPILSVVNEEKVKAA
ncbi:hypothetical protein L6452_01229 [Arctium lappa]|uniref:Uncharacterized protein n=1 Tax=Arctium lappa TaxID=4217 RepID=A0ACB9FFJ1_ARCLA|nr:hypothetical protein L6452_01229 [Arctium lappa]